MSVFESSNYESALIGSVLMDPQCLESVLNVVAPSDFGDEQLKQLFSLIVSLDELNKPIDDLVLLTGEVRRRGIGINAATIAEWFKESMPHNAAYYAHQVREVSKRRRLESHIDFAKEQLQLPETETIDVCDWLSAKIQQVETSSDIELHDAKTIVQKFEEFHESDVIIETGIHSHDDNFGGFTGGELILVGARLGTGKTAIGWQILKHNVSLGKPCLFVSLEMTTQQLFQRHVAAETEIEAKLILQNRLSDYQVAQVDAEKERFKELPYCVFSPPAATVRQIGAAARLMKSGRGLDLLVIDYVQLIRPEKKTDLRQDLIEISARLKMLAKELDIPVIGLCQLNREADGDRRPRVSQIADCDNLGRDADRVLLLHRKEESTDLIVAKHRYVADDKGIELFYRCGKFQQQTEWAP